MMLSGAAMAVYKNISKPSNIFKYMLAVVFLFYSVSLLSSLGIMMGTTIAVQENRPITIPGVGHSKHKKSHIYDDAYQYWRPHLQVSALWHDRSGPGSGSLTHNSEGEGASHFHSVQFGLSITSNSGISGQGGLQYSYIGGTSIFNTNMKLTDTKTSNVEDNKDKSGKLHIFPGKLPDIIQKSYDKPGKLSDIIEQPEGYINSQRMDASTIEDVRSSGPSIPSNEGDRNSQRVDASTTEGHVPSSVHSGTPVSTTPGDTVPSTPGGKVSEGGQGNKVQSSVGPFSATAVEASRPPAVSSTNSQRMDARTIQSILFEPVAGPTADPDYAHRLHAVHVPLTRSSHVAVSATAADQSIDRSRPRPLPPVDNAEAA